MLTDAVRETAHAVKEAGEAGLHARACFPDYKRYAAALMGRPSARPVAMVAVAAPAPAVETAAAVETVAAAVRKAPRKRAAASVLGSGPEAGAATIGDVL